MTSARVLGHINAVFVTGRGNMDHYIAIDAKAWLSWLLVSEAILGSLDAAAGLSSYRVVEASSCLSAVETAVMERVPRQERRDQGEARDELSRDSRPTKQQVGVAVDDEENGRWQEDFEQTKQLFRGLSQGEGR